MASTGIETPERAPGTVDPLAGLGAMAEHYADGGDVPEDLDQTSETGEQVNPISDRVNRALALVNQALMYGYQKHGLSQGQGAQEQPDQGASGTAGGSDNDRDQDDGVIPDQEGQSFEDGGTVEEDPADSSLVPEQEPLPLNSDQSAVGQQSQGVIPDQAQAPEERPLEKAGYAPHQLLQRGAAAIMAMIKGADAAPQEAIDKAKGVVDAEHPNHPGAANLSAAEVLANGNPEKMWAVLQLNRKKFDAAKAFAANALDQNNLPSAADAATQAYHHVLDGTDVKFTPTQQGVMVAIKPLNGPVTQEQLNPQQFRQWLMGRPGQYDNVYASGGQASIQQAAQATPQQQQRPRPGAAPPAGTLRGFAGQGQVTGGQPPAPEDPRVGGGIPGSDKYVAPRATAEGFPDYDPSRDSSTRTSGQQRKNISVMRGDGTRTNVEVISGQPSTRAGHNAEDPYNSLWRVGSSQQKYEDKDKGHNIARGDNGSVHPYETSERKRSGENRIGGKERRLTAAEAGQHAEYPMALRAAAMAKYPGDYTAQMEMMHEATQGERIEGIKAGGREKIANIQAGARRDSAEIGAGARRDVEDRRQIGAGERNRTTNDTRRDVATQREQGVQGRFQQGEQGRNDRTIMQNKPGVIGNENRMNEARKSLGPAQQPQPQRQQAPSLPPEAVRALSEGKHTTFKNGQTWTLQGGRPVQVQ